MNEFEYVCQKGHSSFQEALMLPVYTRRLVEDHSHVSRAVCHHAAAEAVLLQEPLRGERAAAAIQPVSKREQTGISALVDVDIFPSWIILLTPEFRCCFLRF